MRRLEINIVSLAFIYFLFFIVVSCKRETVDSSICNSIPIHSDTYSYPVKPGDKEWSLLIDGYQRIAVCQIPESTLKNISTFGLLESCVSNPLMTELIFSDLGGGGLQFAIEKLFINLNCLSELSQRPDAGHELLKRYILMNPSCVQSGAIDKGKFSNSYSEFEILFSQPVFLSSLNKQELKELVNKALGVYTEKVKFSEYYSWVYGMNTSALLIARTMVLLKYEPFILDKEKYIFIARFIETSALPGNEDDFKMLFNLIIQHANNLISNMI